MADAESVAVDNIITVESENARAEFAQILAAKRAGPEAHVVLMSYVKSVGFGLHLRTWTCRARMHTGLWLLPPAYRGKRAAGGFAVGFVTHSGEAGVTPYGQEDNFRQEAHRIFGGELDG